jgi:putative peptidoglycan lipid II flippase
MRATGRRFEEPEVRLGGYAATAEAAWMGAPQATEFLEPLRLRVPALPRPRLRLPAILNREFSIAEATVILMASFFFSALLGAVRQVLFNARFGAGAEASAYYAAFRLPDTLFSLIAGGALSSAFIPVLLATRREGGDAAAWRLTSLVLNALLACVLLITVALELFAPLFVRRVLVPGYDAQTQDLTVTLTRIMLLQPLVLAAGSVATAVLNSRNQFLLTALSVASHNIALISGILATAAVPRLGIYGPTLGVVLGAVLQLLILVPGLVGAGTRYLPMWDLEDARLREVGRLLLPNGLAVGVGYAGFIVDTAFASRADDPASLAAIQNAWLLVGLPIALLGQAVGQAAFPRLAAHAAAGEYRQLRGTMLRALGVMAALSLLAVAGTFVLGRLTIRVLFEHGEFSAAAGDLTARVLYVYVLGLPAYVATEVLVRALIAMRRPQTQLLTNTLQLLLRVVLVTLLLGALQTRAIPLAFVVSAVLETAALLALALARVRRLERAPAAGA